MSKKYPETSRDDILPSANDFPTSKKNKDWGLQSSESPEGAGNSLNDPVPERRGKLDPNGWQHVVLDTFPCGDDSND